MSEKSHKPHGAREEIDTGNDKRYIRRDEEGHFTDDQVSVSESLARDRQREAQHGHAPGQRDRGDNRVRSWRSQRLERLRGAHASRGYLPGFPLFSA